MFGDGSSWSRGVRVSGRRALVLCGGLAGVCVALVGVQAASGQTPTKPPSTPQKAAVALRARPAARGGRTAASHRRSVAVRS
jgi:hypothetical protein